MVKLLHIHVSILQWPEHEPYREHGQRHNVVRPAADEMSVNHPIEEGSLGRGPWLG